MLVYRITSKKHSRDLSGTGAALFGGRWNKKGTPVLYTGESPEIALLETIVHTPPMLVPATDILTLEIPDHSITQLSVAKLPKNWTAYPAPSILSEIAEAWVQKGETIALQVPSCIISSASNYILNCRHPEFHLVKPVGLEDFRFDERLRK
ncbi:MAG: RES family NAD+ phosphorylase [Adhaeribacter sp.]